MKLTEKDAQALAVAMRSLAGRVEKGDFTDADLEHEAPVREIRDDYTILVGYEHSGEETVKIRLYRPPDARNY